MACPVLIITLAFDLTRDKINIRRFLACHAAVEPFGKFWTSPFASTEGRLVHHLDATAGRTSRHSCSTLLLTIQKHFFAQMGKFTELRFHFIWHDARSLAYRKPAFDGLRPSATSVGVGAYARGLVCFISELCVLVASHRAPSSKFLVYFRFWQLRRPLT